MDFPDHMDIDPVILSCENEEVEEFGLLTLEMARHYSRRANRSRKLTGVIEDFDAEVNRRWTKIVKPPR